VIEQIDEGTGGASRLKITSLLILCATIFILVMFAFFGTSGGLFSYTGSVTGTTANSDLSLEKEEIVVQDPLISGLSEEGKYKLILNIIKLKNLDKKVTKLQFAERVSNIAGYIDTLKNTNVQNVWLSIHSCLEEGCNEKYYELLESVLDNAFAYAEKDIGFIEKIFSNEPPHVFMPELLNNIVGLQKAVEIGDVVETSKSMTAVNSLMSKVDSTEINDLWNELVNCDLKCPIYDELILKLTEFKINSLDV